MKSLFAKHEDPGAALQAMLALQEQVLVLLDSINDVALEVEKLRAEQKDFRKEVRELIALQWSLNGLQEGKGGAPRSVNGKDYPGESQGAMRVPVVGRDGMEAVSGVAQGAGN